jgi:hypothetical protein
MANQTELNDINSGITNSERLLDISNQILNSYSERKKSLKEISAEERLYFNTVSQQQRLSQQISSNSDKYLGFLIKSRDLSRDIKATKDNTAKAEAAYTKADQNGLTLEQKIKESRKIALKAERDLEKEKRSIKQAISDLDFENDVRRAEIQKTTDQSRITTLQQEIKENNRLANLKDKDLQRTDRQITKQHNIAESAKKIIKDQKEAEIAQKKELEFLEKNLIIRTRIEKSTGLLGAVSKNLAKIPGIGQYLNADEAIDEMEKLAAHLEENGYKATDFGNRLKIARKGITTLAKGFYENIKSPEAIFSFFIKAAFKANEESVNLSKNLGYGAANADRVRANFANIESSSSNLNVTTANLSEAFNELSSATGFVTEYSADALETQIKLTKQLGLSGDEAAGVYELSVLNGKSSEATYQSMLKGYVNTRNSLKVGVPFKAAIAEAAKVSGQLAANMGYNAEKIVSGVVATKALGTSLEQAKSQGASLLEFQSSIEDELQAELITGKQLNLEKARAAALMGDQVAVAEELAAQGMTAVEFSKMNVIAQNSYAKALGTTSDELANQLKKREVAIASGKSLAQITADEADEAAERQSIQTKFNVAMEKFQSIIGNIIAGPLGTLLEALSGIFNLISKITSLIPSWLLKLIIGATVGFIAGGPAGLAGAVIGAGLVGAGMVFGNDVVSKPGYGKRILYTPEDTIKLNDKDTIVAGTNLGLDNLIKPKVPSTYKINTPTLPVISSIPQPIPINSEMNKPIKPISSIQSTNPEKNTQDKQTPPLDLTPMISAMNDVKSAIGHLNNKKWDVYLDSSRVGRGMVKGQTQSA